MNTPTMTKTAFRPGSMAKNTKPAPSKKKAPPNGNILSFFKRVAAPEEPMFVGGSSGLPASEESVIIDLVEQTAEESTTADFSEDHVPAKKRRLNAELEKESSTCTTTTLQQRKPLKPSHLLRGPFVDDSEDDSEDGCSEVDNQGETGNSGTNTDCPYVPDGPNSFGTLLDPDQMGIESSKETESSSREDDFGNVSIDEENYFDEDDTFEGEEFLERKYMELQEQFESEAARDDTLASDSSETKTCSDAMVKCCPICGISLGKSTPDEATVHVNACLDGSAIPPDNTGTLKNTEHKNTVHVQRQTSLTLSRRFARTSTPRPGQPNPASLGMTAAAPAVNSAFAKLMSSHAENYAWAAAAATEHSSRGKPRFERTCPFYKIMPGTFICVDAFRYGAVEGCRAYFLSHFHSDHYVGLTAKWSHGPIYCSKVTGSLVKNQLGTAGKWVVELDFESTVDVPGTEGVRVTMIPANHCPGSSMFLFEKTLAGNRTQRILHCGDFRACPEHVRHPLLQPRAVDVLTGKTKQQKIDICYLDTTYLNPRYSFPPQGDVITACADLCAALDRNLKTGEEDAWDRLLGGQSSGRKGAGRGGEGCGSVSKFFTKGGADAKVAPDEARSAIQASPFPPVSGTAIPGKTTQKRNRLLVICGTYSIGKERICKTIAQVLGTKIFATPAKIRVIAQLGDPELTALMTSDATEAQVHMQMLMEIRAETLAEYLDSYQPHFSRIIGFRPSGWNYRPAVSRGNGGKGTTTTPVVGPSANLVPGTLPTPGLLHSPGWRTRFRAADLVPQRGSTREAMCFGVPYSEHSSFRELAMFIMALHIEKVVPTVNVGSEQSRKRMKMWIDRWMTERRRGGVLDIQLEAEVEELQKELNMWEGKDGRGGSAYW